MKKLLGMGALLLGLSAPAHATPNFLGVSGLLNTPSAYTVGSNQAGAYFSATPDYTAGGVLAGIGNRFEVGVTVLGFDTSGRSDTNVLANAKFALLREKGPLPAVAVGVTDAFDSLNIDPSWYLVASKDLTKILGVTGLPLRVHAGYGGGLYNDRPFFGAELGLGTPLDLLPVTHPHFSAIAEYQDEDVNLGLRGSWKGLSGTVSLFDFDRVGFALSYTTGIPKFK